MSMWEVAGASSASAVEPAKSGSIIAAHYNGSKVAAGLG